MARSFRWAEGRSGVHVLVDRAELLIQNANAFPKGNWCVVVEPLMRPKPLLVAGRNDYEMASVCVSIARRCCVRPPASGPDGTATKAPASFTRIGSVTQSKVLVSSTFLRLIKPNTCPVLFGC